MIKKIAVTGTKGKTTVVNFIAEILSRYEYSRVLHVNTTGHFINGERRSTLEDSKRVWGLVPSVAPGRYLYEFMDHRDDENVAAVLETSLGCSTLSGMAYAMHHVGIFLNVFEDHIGSSDRIHSQDDLVEAKKFVVSRIFRNGFVVLNADDPFVMKLVPELPEKRNVHPIFFGLSLTKSSLPAERADAPFVTVIDDMISYCTVSEPPVQICHLADIAWTFEGRFIPSVYNALAIVAGVIASFEGEVPEALGEKLAATKMDRFGGRLTRLLSDAGVEIIADYAHEKKSLTEVARLAKKLVHPGGKVIGVVRLAYDRTDALLQATGVAIASEFDTLIVYDKIDGYWKQANENLQFDRFTQVVGRTSQVLFDAIHPLNASSERVVREDEAILRAAALAKQGDVVVVIVNDDIRRSIGFIQTAFAAKFQ